MTQTQHHATAAPADSGWSSFTNWLTAKRVTLCALGLVGVQVGLNSYVLTRDFFQQDDFAIAGLASRSFGLHMLFYNYNNHLLPGGFALTWVLTHAGGGYDWGLWEGLLVALQALAGLALLRALRTLVGNRMAILVPLGLYLLTPMTLPALSWWSVGINSVPLELAIPLALDQHVRYVRGGRIRNAVFAAGWLLFGLAFFEKSAGIVLLLFALTTAFLVPGRSWPAAILTTLRRHWLAWTMYVTAVVIEIVVYLVTLSNSTVKPQAPQASTAAAFSWNLLWHNFVPSAFGGPWRWTPPGATGSSWVLNAIASAPVALAVMSWLLGALVVFASLWYRRGAWKAWVIVLGWVAIVDIAPVELGRVEVFGTLLSNQTRYISDSAPVLAVCVALAFLPLRGEQHPYRVRLTHGRLRAAAIGALAVVFLAGAVTSYAAYRGQLHPQNSRSYLATASVALSDAPAGSVIYASRLPEPMAMGGFFGKYSEVENALGPLINQTGRTDLRFAARPYGVADNFLIFDGQGRLRRALVTGAQSYPYAKPSDCYLTAAGMQLPLNVTSFSGPLLMQVPYFSAQPVTLAITFGGHQYTMNLPAHQLTNVYLPVEGPGNLVGIMPLTPPQGTCVGPGITVGFVQANPFAPAIPPAPLPG